MDAVGIGATNKKAQSPANLAAIAAHTELDHAPFDPVAKRTVSIVRAPDGSTFKVSKGAPQVLLRMAWNAADITAQVKGIVDDLASRGFRSLGVARAVAAAGAAADAPDRWEYLGVLSLFDPPRPDSAATIKEALANGVDVKMVTGGALPSLASLDRLNAIATRTYTRTVTRSPPRRPFPRPPPPSLCTHADHGKIAKETCRELGMGTSILNTEELDEHDVGSAALDKIILEAHGFAEVLPEHKYLIVKRIQAMGHVTGMTGDGVNDAPALKRADIGIAVHGATDAAKAAASIVLTEPGLSVIIDAIYESRRIFQRMRSYFIYRMTCTIQILAFFFFMIICANLDDSYFYNGIYPTTAAPASCVLPACDPTAAYPGYSNMAHAQTFSLPVLALVFLTIIDDGACIAVSSDTIKASQKPQLWAMYEMWIVSTTMGLLLALSTLLLCTSLMNSNQVNPGGIMGTMFASNGRDYMLYTEAATVIFLQLCVSNMLTLVAARERGPFFGSIVSWPLGVSILCAFIVGIVFSLFWTQMFTGGGAETYPNTGMASLYTSNGAVVATFIYCWLWFCVQDVVKVGTYYLIDRYFVPLHDKLVAAHAAKHAPSALKDAAHPTEGAAVIVQRAHRHGAVGETAQLTVTNQGTVVVHEKKVAPKSTLAGIFNPTSSAAEEHIDRVHETVLPNNVDLTALVLGVQGTVRKSHGRLSGAAAAVSQL